MIYLTGVTNTKIEPALIASGVGLIIQPGTNGYVKRIGRYPFWAADNGCFNPKDYVGDDAWIDWLDTLPRDRCLFVVIPDVARRPDGTLGGDPVATWDKFCQFAPIVRDMGFPAALAAQDGIENMPNLLEQLEACDALFIAGSTEWKISQAAERVAKLARNLGRWVHMGRCNSYARLRRARDMGCTSADGTFLAFGPDANLPRLQQWLVILDKVRPFPQLIQFEGHTLPVHKEAARATA